MSEEESFEPKERITLEGIIKWVLIGLFLFILLIFLLAYYTAYHNSYIESNNECDGDCQMHRFQWFCQDRGFVYGINDIDKEDSGRCCYNNHTCEEFV